MSCRFRLNSWANAATVVGMFVGGGTHVVVVSGGRKPKTKFCVLEEKWASWRGSGRTGQDAVVEGEGAEDGFVNCLILHKAGGKKRTSR